MNASERVTHDRLYPEIATAGNLAAAISRAAEELGIDLGEVSTASSRGWAVVASKAPARRGMGIGTGAVERWFLLSAWSRGVQLVSGKTQDLHDVVRAAAAWREGLTLQRIQDAAPFLNIGDMAFAHERGPAHAVDLTWQRLHRRAAEQSPDSPIGDADTGAEAIALVMTGLPEDLGPAVAGSIEEESAD